MNEPQGGSVVTCRRVVAPNQRQITSVDQSEEETAPLLAAFPSFTHFNCSRRNVALILKALQDIRSFMCSHHTDNKAASQSLSEHTHTKATKRLI